MFKVALAENKNQIRPTLVYTVIFAVTTDISDSLAEIYCHSYAIYMVWLIEPTVCP